jgi:hypothetical protein
MLNIKNRVMATAALLSIAVIAPTSVLIPSAEAAVVVKQSVSSSNLIADRHHDGDYEYSERHGRYINTGRHRKHHHNHGNYQYSSSTVYQSQQPKVIYTQPQVIYQPQVVTVPSAKKCVRTLYSTICN